MIDPREDTHLRILAATRELYAERGSKGTTTREVADRAGVNEATLFRHFGTKQQLLAAMFDHCNDADALSELIVHLRTLGSLEEQLRALGGAAIDAIKRKEDLIRVSMAEECSNPQGIACAWRGPTEARLRLAAFFEEKVRLGELRGEPDFLTRTFMSLFFSYVIARKLWGDFAFPTERAVGSFVDLFLEGARA